jgi:ABC-2 type transport system permease protein
MGKTLVIIAREYVAIVRKKSFLIGLFLVPGIMALAFLVPVLMMKMKTGNQRHIAVIDHTGRLYGGLVSQLDGKLKDGRPQYLIRLEPSDADTARVQARLIEEIDAGDLDALLVIPTAVYEGEEAAYYGKTVSNVDETNRLQGILTEAVVAHRLGEQGLDPESVREWTKRVVIKTVKISRGTQKESGFIQEYIGSFLFAMMLYFVLIFYGVAVMRGVMEEKASRMVEVLLSSVRAEQMMVGKILGIGAAGLTQVAVWTGVAVGVSALNAAASGPGTPMGIEAGTIIYFGVFFILGYFLYATIYAMIGSIYSSEQEAQNVQILVVMPLMVPLVSIVFVTKSPDATLSVVLSMIPLFSPILMFVRINVLTPPILEIAASILILVGTVALAMWIAARVYRTGILMQGKRATLPEIVRWVRQG